MQNKIVKLRARTRRFVVAICCIFRDTGPENFSSWNDLQRSLKVMSWHGVFVYLKLRKRSLATQHKNVTS